MKRCLSAFALVVFSGVLPAETLDSVLARMDKTAPTIHAMTADVQMVTYESVLDDRTVEKGTLRMQKQGSDLRAIIEFTGGNDARTFALLGKYAEIYTPQTRSYKKYDLGKNAAQANALLLLGFGSTGSDLTRSYDVQVAGSEKLAGQDTTKLELIPKDAGLKQHLAKVWLWIPANAGYPIQQQFFDPPPSGNWRLVDFSNVNLQASIPGKLSLPAGAKEE